jgi:hypothetical protein
LCITKYKRNAFNFTSALFAKSAALLSIVDTRSPDDYSKGWLATSIPLHKVHQA